MLTPRMCLIATVAAIAAYGPAFAAEEQCLSRQELSDVARMSSVMAIGGALKRCGTCLGDRYRPTVDKYEASGMLVEFRRAESAIQTSRSKFEYADDLVRVAARKYAADLSADCDACNATAELVGKLGTTDERSTHYDVEAEKIAAMPAYKACPSSP